MVTSPGQAEGVKFDPRTYLAVLVFRWKVIFLSILSCLLGAVLYLAYTPYEWLTSMSVMICRDPSLTVTDSGAQQWSSIQMHMWLLSSKELNDTVIQQLQKEWQPRVGGLRQMEIPLSVELKRGHGSLVVLSMKNSVPEYARAYISAVWEEFKKRQEARKDEVSGKAIGSLQGELDSLEAQIRQAQDELMDYSKLVAYDVVAASSDMDRRYLLALLSHKNQLDTERQLLDAEFPMIENQGAAVLANIESLTRNAGQLAPVGTTESIRLGAESRAEPGGALAVGEGKTVFTGLASSDQHIGDAPEVQRWSTMKVELMRLQALTNSLLAKFTSDHPDVKAAVKQIENVQEQLRVSYEVAYGRLKDRRNALRILSDSLDKPIDEWDNRFRQAGVNESVYKRKALVIERRETLYRTLYSRLQDLKVSEELKADHFVPVAPVRTEEEPVWPDPVVVMLVALVIALGAGVGLAVLAQMFDNRMQTIADVELVLGLPFLGGVPRWTGSGTDKVARPIVLEENASGAMEAYRVLRTNVISAMDKAGRKVVFFTSTEAKEGKTITILNLAVMLARVGKKVLLVDMDMRRPRLHRSLRCERFPGVTDALMKGIPLHDMVVPTEVESLSFIPSGSECANVAELLQSTDLTGFLGEVVQRFDYVLVDTSPVLRAADVCILASRAPCSIVYIARVNHTPKPLVKFALEQLPKGAILGVVMNQIDLSKVSSLYYAYQYPNYAYYAYSYAYGYDYDHYSDGVKGRPKKPGKIKSAIRNFVQGVRTALTPTD